MTLALRTYDSLENAESQEEIACPLCRSEVHSLALNAKDRLFGRPGGYKVVRCNECALRYVNPRPTVASLGHHYPSNYFAYTMPNELPALLKPVLQFMTRGISLRRLRYIEDAVGRLTPDTSIVDIGCGINSLLYWAKRKRGVEGIGVDFKPEVVEWVRRELGMPMEQGTLESVGFESGRFDVVSMTEYLEHEPDPSIVLREAHRVLKPGGHVAIEIPDPTGWPARVFGPVWWNLDVPRHLVFFDPSTLERLLNDNGFELVSVRRFGLPCYVGTSLYQWLGLPYRPRLHSLFLLVSGILGMPFVPFTRLVPEFLFAVGRAR